MIDLRDYQKNCIESIFEAEKKGIKNQLIVAATGAGKTIIFGSLIAQRKQRALILAHTGELLKQSQDKLRMISPEISSGLVCANRKEFDSQVVISSIQSAQLPQNLEKLKAQKFELIVIDEAHHAAADTYRFVIENLGCGKNNNLLLLGFTATAFREDKLGLAEVFDKVTYEIKLTTLIDQGYLVKPHGIRMMSNLDLSRVELSNSDFNISSLTQVMDTPEMISAVVDSYVKHAESLSAICFGCSISHAENLANAFLQRGIRATSISGQTPKNERERILKSYSIGEIDVLTNCSLLTEGVDLPITQAVIIARPTKSKSLFTQMAGRALRLFPNKTRAIILDFGDVAHSLITTSELLKDSKIVSIEDERLQEKIKEKMLTYPAKLNQKLKLAAVQAELLLEEHGFAWTKDIKGRYFVKGFGNALLRIDHDSEDLYSVRLYSGNWIKKEYGSNLDFEYAFALASKVIKENKKFFVIADLNALWRQEPISSKQIDFLKKERFSAGLRELTRGQASMIIGSKSLIRATK